jgi:hypothetical protein
MATQCQLKLYYIPIERCAPVKFMCMLSFHSYLAALIMFVTSCIIVRFAFEWGNSADNLFGANYRTEKCLIYVKWMLV